jgi:hypothetical protein
MAQAGGCRPLIVEPRVRSQARSFEFCDGVVLGQVSLDRISASPVSVIPPTLHTYFTQLWAKLYNLSNWQRVLNDALRNRIFIPSLTLPRPTYDNTDQDRQWTCQHNIEAHWRNHCCRGTKNVLRNYCECVSVALVTQHAKRMRHIILSSVASLDLPYFSTSYKCRNFRKKVNEHEVCVLISSTTFVGNTPHSKKNSARYYRKCA